MSRWSWTGAAGSANSAWPSLRSRSCGPSGKVGGRWGLGLLLLVPAAALGACGSTETRVVDHPYVGRTFAAGGDAYYQESCRPESVESCGTTPRAREIDRVLTCAERVHETEARTPGLYRRIRELGVGARFTVVELLDVRPVGISAAFGSPHSLAVLEDDEGVLSTVLFGGPLPAEPYAFGEGGVCDWNDD